MERLAAWPPLRQLTSVSGALRLVATVVLLIVVGAAYYQLSASRQEVIAETERQMARLDMVFAEQTGRAVEVVDLLICGALETVQLHLSQSAGMDGIGATLRQRIKDVRQLASIAVVNGAGQLLASTDADNSPAALDTITTLIHRYREHPRSGLLISPPFQVADGTWNALLARPMLDPDGAFVGMALGFIDLSYFEKFYQAVELNENGAISLHLRDGTLLARFPHINKAIGSGFGDLPPFKQVLANAMAGTLLMESPVDGSIRITAVRALRAFPLAVMVSVDQRRILVGWRRSAFALFVAAVVLGGAVVLLLLLLSHRSREVERLLDRTDAARDLAEGAKDRLLQQISERERAEGALREAQRIEAIGQLTGGVAHDFNNLLTVVLGNVEMLQRRTSMNDGATTARLKAIRGAAERGATLTGHLLAFARRQPLLPKPVDLNVAIRGMHDLLDSALAMRARIDLRLASDLWPAMVDKGQFELVVLNLVINARDAVTDGSVVTIETSRHCRTEADVADRPPAGDYVRVIVRDRGTGMPPEVLARVFEPFFTTKAPGSGSGLGLSQVFGTARQSGGEVRIESEVGRGTTVIVDLPRAALAPARASGVRREVLLRGSAAAILLVDDDEQVRGTIGAMLRDLGYAVREAGDGEEALAALDQEAGLDILLTDLVMPEMNGSQLAIAATSRRPDLSVVFLSGYADQLGDALTFDHPLIRKPLARVDLYQTIETVLTARRSLPATDAFTHVA